VLKGCLFLIAAWAGLTWYESLLLEGRDLPMPGVLAFVLAMLLAATLGNLHGIWMAIVGMRGAAVEPGQWTPGSVVRVSGIVMPRSGNGIQTPVQKRNVVAYTYLWGAKKHAASEDSMDFCVSGMDRVPIELRTPAGPIQLDGFPSLEHFPPDHLEGVSWHRPAAAWVLSRQWEERDLKGLNATSAAQQVAKTLSGEMPAKLPLDLMSGRWFNRLLSEEVGGVEGKLVALLSAWYWRFEERFIPMGATISVKGKYRDNPPSIDVQASLFNMDLEVRPGTAAGAAKGELIRAIVGLVLTGGLAVAAHWDIYVNDAYFYRQVFGS